jgi:3-oxoadipate enol-lactonase
VSAIDVHHRIDGADDAPALVLSNSLGTDLRLWDDHVPALAQSFRVVRCDTRGHGGSPVPAGPYRIADLVDDVVALLDRLGIERASFCGVSLGGMIGMALGVAAPDRLDRLAVCCTSARLGPPEVWHERATAVRESGTGAVVDTVIGRWFTESFRSTAPEPEPVHRAREMILATPSEGYAGCCEAIAEMDQLESIADISAPTLVVAADQDPSTPPEHADAIAKRIPGASVVVLSDAAHLAVLERPDAFRAAVLDHLLDAGSGA